jgi:hypothetical protein
MAGGVLACLTANHVIDATLRDISNSADGLQQWPARPVARTVFAA